MMRRFGAGLVALPVLWSASLAVMGQASGFDFSRPDCSQADTFSCRYEALREATSKVCDPILEPGWRPETKAREAFAAVHGACGSEPLPLPEQITLEVLLGASLEHFRLGGGCKPMRLYVSTFNDASEIGLIKEDLMAAAAESRLRAARLYASSLESTVQELRVDVNVVGPAFNSAVSFAKFMRDPSTGTAGFAAVWERSSVGTHGRNASYVIGSVSQLLDGFLVEYLRVNETACESR